MIKLRSTKKVAFESDFPNRINFLEMEYGNFTELKSGGYLIEIFYYEIVDEELQARVLRKKKDHFISNEKGNTIATLVTIPEGLTEREQRDFKKNFLFPIYVQNDWIDNEETTLIYGLLPNEFEIINTEE